MKIVKEGGVSMQEKLNYKRTFFVGLAFLSICAFWQMYDNIIPLILQNTFGLGETVTGGLMAMDNVLRCFCCLCLEPFPIRQKHLLESGHPLF